MYINPVCNATIFFTFLLHFHSTQHVSALYGHLQVSESVSTATLHLSALKLHTRNLRTSSPHCDLLVTITVKPS
jgi:hypothetical protein